MISIGGHTPLINAGGCSIVKPDKPSATKPTYGGVAYFAWPATIVGKVIELTWNMLNASDFATFDGFYSADTTVVFDPDNGSGTTYNAKITELDGTYYLQYQYRTDVKLKLLILSEVA